MAAKLQVGDRVTVNPDAFDFQTDTVLNPEAILEVVKVNNRAPEGSSGQWVKLKGNIRLRPHSGERIRNGAGWIDAYWCSLVTAVAPAPGGTADDQ